MPNYVYNKISFECDNPRCVIEGVTTNGHIDFNSLIPCPLHIYRGDLSSDDEKDFGSNVWYAWSKTNWGTKWNAGNSRIEATKNHVDIWFETAWSPPYPFIIAFANKFKIDFTYQYLCETKEYWGIEEWKFATQMGHYEPSAYRHGKSRDNENEWRQIYISINGNEPHEEDE